MAYDNKYYFSNSNFCGRKGSRANDNNGKACVIDCDNFDEFVRICKRTTGSKNVQFTLDYVDVEVFDIHNDSKETETHQSTERVAAASQMINSQRELTDQIISLQTSVTAPIDVMQPNVEDEIQVSGNLIKIIRKTKDNIVNVDHELKAGEFARRADQTKRYIAKYLSKTEPEGVDFGIAQAIQQIQREESDISRKLFRICMKILHERQVSAAECAYRLCHIPLRDSSRSCIFLNTRKPEQRYRVLQFDKSAL
ncbi:ATP-dependent DNA helicase [Caerostris darwini]|uniref:ATP-dependent DNA helicase n=1 Tax=Caerostris darwini TaxID=1538125 RepID=A0AAV4Q705_9ARAC|nr:ATP-dependent DNA helicase [Caerostris darwini]